MSDEIELRPGGKLQLSHAPLPLLPDPEKIHNLVQEFFGKEPWEREIPSGLTQPEIDLFLEMEARHVLFQGGVNLVPYAKPGEETTYDEFEVYLRTLAATYGRRFQVLDEFTVATWFVALSRFRIEDIKSVTNRCRGEWPPTLSDIRNGLYVAVA